MSQSLQEKARTYGAILYFFAFYTLTIKYVLPVSWALLQGVPWTSFIYFWDAWWIAHIAVGFGLRLKRNPFYWRAALLLSVVEILIIAVKFALFLPNPNWDFWHLNWFINKSLMIVFFIVLLRWLLKKEVRSEFGF